MESDSQVRCRACLKQLMAKTSIRDLARSLGLSHTTVSEALRDSPRVRQETRERVVRAAAEAGYHYNPLAGALMSEMRRAWAGTFRGTIAIVDLESQTQRPEGSRRYHRELAAAAKAAADRLGFKVELLILGEKQIAVERLNTILNSRGIHGILLLPAGSSPHLEKLSWNEFAGIYLDYLIDHPPINSVCSDHFRSMVIALRRLSDLGYRRPGLVLHQPHDRRLLYRWEAAYNTFVAHEPLLQGIPPHIVDTFEREAFLDWFKAGDPDVVMAHDTVILRWMREAGIDVPGGRGYCSLNVVTSELPCAGLDLQPRLIGSRGMELLIGQLHRNDLGIPEVPASTTIPAVWVPGPTIRDARGA